MPRRYLCVASLPACVFGGCRRQYRGAHRRFQKIAGPVSLYQVSQPVVPLEAEMKSGQKAEEFQINLLVLLNLLAFVLTCRLFANSVPSPECQELFLLIQPTEIDQFRPARRDKELFRRGETVRRGI